VRAIFRARAAAGDAQAERPGSRRPGLPDRRRRRSWSAKVAALKAEAATPDAKAIEAAEKAVKDFPADAAAAKKAWDGGEEGAGARAAPVKRHAEAFGVGGKTPEEVEKNRSIAKKNFLVLIACLMIGTAALPHILMRYYTTPSVHEARVSVFWGLFFIFLLYFTAPALAILAKYEVYSNLVGSSFSALPGWVSNWSTVDKTLMNIADINKDGIVQLAEVVIGGDLIVLATPEIAGLPYVISGLVAAGGLAAALSTADGLLADHRQRHVARPVLQDDRPERLDGSPYRGVQGPAARGGPDGRLRHQPEAGRHPVPGRRGLLAGGLGLLPGAGLRGVLEARQLPRRGAGHGPGSGRVRVLHGP
jgi:cation/acetate symporter